ncbi:(4Fe-4S)-binding protein [Meridianimarinicoccus roseus]|uniref:(4Fe-4S)-binding protein n=1 Tax=Meridianimarinicoccus roseus TaxID=2072018 RepID=A0A2V2LLC0_9RHOB|nr:4Fe-4S binding protein [Meridianimarinicoccus roseus]PWR04384.1 (4Fe-4S)-binding protein [Meridianimarinicoccus roseus]
MTKRLVLCSCEGSQTIAADTVAAASGMRCSRVHSALCTTELSVAADVITAGDAIIACGQERARFEDLAAELGAEVPGFVDLRDRAGWSDENAAAGPKMAALAAEALLAAPDGKSLDVVSEGLCLIVGPGEVALDAAERLAGALSVTVLLTDGAEPPLDRGIDVITGRLKRVEGALGGFRVTIDALRQMAPGGRGGFGFGAPRDVGVSECDVLIDLTGGVPFVPAPQKREGYLRADPGDPLAVARLMVEAVQLVGTFEKPLYVRLEEQLCAHSRAGQVGCTRCLDICPTGAIVPAGDHVSIDPMVCAGCGACSALCPSGAISYDAPPVSHLLRRLEVLARVFREAGGTAPRLLVHDTAHGAEMIRLCARFGRGLPADVIPLELDVISGFGHAEMLAALASGFAAVDLLLAPRTERDALDRELALAEAIAGPGRLRLLDVTDPDALPGLLYGAAVPASVADPVLPMGGRRQVARLAGQALNPGAAAPLPLPEGAPYGAVLVNTEACTLCLSCVSLCPSGALIDNPDRPELRFQEDACLQCGICRTICPEDAIALEPRLDLSDAALGQQVLNEEEPFACVECGALFGVKSTVEKITEKLAGKHSMFGSGDAARMIQMCDDCRVKAQFGRSDNPFAMGGPRRPRTTDDYLADRGDAGPFGPSGRKDH